MLKLYHNDMSSCAQKVRFVLTEKGLDWSGEELDLRRGDQMRPEFLKINPKGLVPALVHDGEVLVESNVIIEYLDEAFPEPPLLPQSPLARARARWWMKKLDDGIHLELAAVSFAIAFRHQLIAACGTDEALAAHFDAIPDPYLGQVQREVVPGGLDSSRFRQAITEFDRLLRDLDEVLAGRAWIVGDALSLVDIAYAPYATRLEHLHLHGMWDARPNFARWYDRLKTTTGYREGLTRWFNPKYLALMDEAGRAAWPGVLTILESAR